jgi:hypothetical protein
MTGEAEPCDGADRCDIPMYIYAVRPRKDRRGVNLISDALPLGRLWYGEPNAVSRRMNSLGIARPLIGSLVENSSSL